MDETIRRLSSGNVFAYGATSPETEMSQSAVVVRSAEAEEPAPEELGVESPPADDENPDTTASETNAVDEENAAANKAFMKQMHTEKLHGKLAFTLGVMNLVVTIFLVSKYAYAMCIFYSAKVFILFSLRFKLFYDKQLHYFMTEFCYFGNLLLLCFLWIVPQSAKAKVFLVVFGVCNGPLGLAVLMFRNKLVFHSVNHISSVFLHLTPVAVTWCVRWHMQDEFKLCVPGDSELRGDECTSFAAQAQWILGGACLYFICHEIFYYILIECLCMNCNKSFASGKNADGKDAYMTSFRMMTKSSKKTKDGDEKEKNIIHIIVFSCGKKMSPFIWGLLNLAYCASTTLPAILYYNYQWVHTVVGFLILTFATWEGADFYYERFAESGGTGRHASATGT